MGDYDWLLRRIEAEERQRLIEEGKFLKPPTQTSPNAKKLGTMSAKRHSLAGSLS
jgi:hypothetical protein